MKKIVILLMIVAILTGCATTRTLYVPQTHTDKNIESVYQQGNLVAISKGDATDVAAMMDMGDDYLVLEICCVNNGAQNIDINPVDVSMTGITSKGIEKEIKVHPPEKVLSDLKFAQGMQALSMALSSAAQAINAGRTTTYHSGSTNYYDSGGSYGYGSYSGTSTTYDATAAALQQQQSQQQMAAMATNAENVYCSTEQQLLKRTTLMPGQSIGGKVCFKKKKVDRYIVRIPLGSEIHEIEFIPEKQNKQ